jgi:hypothetical protein
VAVKDLSEEDTSSKLPKTPKLEDLLESLSDGEPENSVAMDSSNDLGRNDLGSNNLDRNSLGKNDLDRNGLGKHFLGRNDLGGNIEAGFIEDLAEDTLPELASCFEDSERAEDGSDVNLEADSVNLEAESVNMEAESVLQAYRLAGMQLKSAR